jgi:multidrug efflux system membrane fusion protein
MNPRLPAVALALATLSLVGCSPDAAPPDTAAPPTPVRIAPATSGPAVPPITADGLVAHKDEMQLSFKLGGVLRRIAVEEGQLVRKGESLAEIELTEINAQVEQARQLADKAGRDLQRGERLHADEVISLEQLEGLRTQASVAQATLASARFNLGQSSIVAPRDGVVLRRLAEERELVAPGAPVIVLGARDAGYVVSVALGDREVLQVRRGDAASVRVDAHAGREIPARVTEVSAAADPRSGLFSVELAVEAADVALASGMVARARIMPGATGGATLTYVPIAAVIEGDGQRALVYLPVDGRARRREVRVAFITSGQVALTEGVQPGDAVITEGALYLGDGEAIQVATTAGK